MIVFSLKQYSVQSHVFFILYLCTVLLGYPFIANGKEISLEQVMQQAIAHSHNVQLADIDVEISQYRLTESRAAYYPTLNLRYTNEWFDDLTDGNGDWDSVGGTVISATGSKWKNILGASLNYNLYDFGIRERQVDNARRDVAIAGLTRSQEGIDLALQVLDLYISGLKGQEEMQGQRLARELRQEIFSLSQRLHQAGSLDRMQMGEAAIAVAESSQRLDDLLMARAEILHGLTMLSGELYDEDETHFLTPHYIADINTLNVNGLPEIQAYDLAIRKKQAEYEIARNSYFPRVSLYSSYSFYGSDSSDWSQSISNMEEANLACGVTLDLNVFNGFADKANAARLQAEVRRMKVERSKKIAEHEANYRSLQHHAKLLAERRESHQRYRHDLEGQTEMADRLAKEQIQGRLATLNQRVAIAAKEIQISLQEIEQTATLLKLQILAGGEMEDGANLFMNALSRSGGATLGIGD